MIEYEVSKWSSNALAANVVVYRSLGINKELSLACMSELLRREKFGDNFKFEDFIDRELAKMPERPPKQNINDAFGSIVAGLKSLTEEVENDK